MRTLLLLLAASTLSVASSSAAAPAARPDDSSITLVETASQPRPGGGQRVHYTIYQRVQPLTATRQAGNGALVAAVTSGDAVALSYEQDPDRWIALGTLTVDHFGTRGAAAASVASVAASASAESAPAAPLVLAIAPVHPDPVRSRALVVDVALPNADPARLELMDIMGRRVAMHDLGSLGVGRHSVNLGAGQRFAPGVYLLRLTQGGEARVARVTVVD